MTTFFPFQDFESIIEVKNLNSKESYMIHERVKRDSVWLQMTKPNDEKLRTCTYSKLSGFGHTIYGKQHQKKFQGILQILGINLGAKKCNKSIKEAFLVSAVQCGNLWISLSFRFYVKSKV